MKRNGAAPRREPSRFLVARASSTTLWSIHVVRRGSTRLEGVPGEFCEGFVWVRPLARPRAWLRENACSRLRHVALKACSQGAEASTRGHCCRPADGGACLPTLKNLPTEGSLCRGTPWGTGALVPYTKHLPQPPLLLALPNNALHAFRPAAIPALFSGLLVFPRRISPRLGHSVYRSARKS